MSRKRPTPDKPVQRDGYWSCRVRFFDVRIGRRQSITLTGPDKKTAQRLAQARLDFELEEMQRSEAGRAPVSKSGMNLGELFDEARTDWLPNHGRERHQADIERMWRRYWAPLLRTVLVADLQVGHVGRVLARARKLGRKTATCNRILSAGSVVIEYAVALGMLRGNPAQARGLRQREVVREQDVLDADQARRLVEALPARWRPLVGLMIYAGLRLGEARALRWRDIVSDELVVRRSNAADETKGKRDRRLPIIEPLRVIIASAGRGAADDPVSRHGYPYKALERAAKKAGIGKHVHPHLLRHSFGTILSGNGVSIDVVQRLMGHSSVATTRRYLHNRVSAAAVARAFGEDTDD